MAAAPKRALRAPSLPSPHAITRVMSEVDQLRASLADTDTSAEEFLVLFSDETDLMTIVDRIEELVSMKADYAARAKARASALERQAQSGRALLQNILLRLEVPKLERPTATLSLVAKAQSLVITDESLVPFQWTKTVADTSAIKDALKQGELVPGATLSGPAQTLRITRGKAAPETDETTDATNAADTTDTTTVNAEGTTDAV